MAEHTGSQYRLGLALVVGSALLFSFKAVLVKLAYRYHIDPVTLMTLRMLFAAPIYLYIAAHSLGRRNSRALTARQWLQVSLLGLSGYYLASILDLSGLQYITASLERLILYLYPSLVMLMSIVLFGRRIQVAEMCCLLGAYVGLALVFASDLQLYGGQHIELANGFELPQVVWGGLLVFASAASFACYVMGSERMMRHMSPAMFTSLAILASTLGISIHFLLTRQLSDLLHWPWQLYTIALAMALLTTVIPSFMAAEGIKRISAARAGIIGSIGPISTMIFGALLLGELITSSHIIGLSIVIFSSLALSRLKPAASQ